MGLALPESVYQMILAEFQRLGIEPDEFEFEYEDGIYFVPFEVFDAINWLYDDETGALYNLNLLPSQNGYFIGNY